MLPLPKFIKPWKDAGEANALFAPCSFIDDHVFLTKTGALGIVFELAGIDPECLTDATMEAHTKRLGCGVAPLPRGYPALSVRREAR